MILIKSNSSDFSTTHVIKWLRYLGKPYLRINEEQIESIEIATSGHIFLKMSDGSTIDFRQLTNYWYRRGRWAFTGEQVEEEGKVAKLMLRQNKSEKNSLLAYLNESLKDIGDFSDQYSASQANKMLQLRSAEKIGLSVPDYLLCSDRSSLETFHRSHGPLITKVLDFPIFFLFEDTMLPTYTIKVGPEEIDRLPEHFSPSLFQKLVPKKYEIRSFFMDDRFFSMAIFSQKDDQTKVDFRNYNWVRPNRNVPYQLPAELEDQLRALMRELQLQSGSFDLIYTPQGRYVFLEVNPIGQFGMVSIPCNYYLEKEIALFLSRSKHE